MGEDRQPLLDALLAATHLVVPDELPDLIQRFGRRLGSATSVLYLVDLDQRWLVPLQLSEDPERTALPIDGTLAGRSFRSLDIVDASDQSAPATWLPVVDGTERLGVLHLVFHGDRRGDRDEVKAFAGLIAELLMTKQAYGDFIEITRRRRPLTVTAELLWQLLPPLTFGTDDLVIAAAMTPTSTIGGDAFDYGVDCTHAQIAIFDAVGHDLTAGLLATTAIAAFRNARRSKLDQQQTMALIGATIGDQFGDALFVTGIVAWLDIEHGSFSWATAGHPPPLLIRKGRVVKELHGEPGMPFGIGPGSATRVEQLEPGDRVLLYTDGVTEARSSSGELFGVSDLSDIISHGADDLPPPETMRLLMHAIEAHNAGVMRDDATAVMIEWRGRGSGQLDV